MATDGTDFISFQGVLQQVSVTLVNPYSSKSYDVDEEYRVNTGSYDGLGGEDYLLMSNDGDYLSLTDNSTGMQVVRNIEHFVAGDGGDVINLADATLTYGDVTIYGGDGDDILWSNAGSDTIYGATGDDIIDGGPGHDTLYGNADHDVIFGGEGDDRLEGGEGNDILYGGTDLGLRDLDKNFLDTVTFPELKSGRSIEGLGDAAAALGISGDNLVVDYDASATLTFREGFAGYNNTLGVYRIAEDGTIESASVLWANVKTAGIDIDHQIDLPLGADGGELGFFIIANGDRKNKGYDDLDITEEGNIKFIYDYGGANERAATVHDDGNLVSVVYDDGETQQVLKGYHYHTTPRGETPDINYDGEVHALSGLTQDGVGIDQILRIGFEDLPNLGDADYEDVLFDLNINAIHVDASETGSDILIGGAGDDILYGEGGDDILVIGDGLDQAYGGAGSDQFVYDIADGLMDVIHDFEAGAGGDVLNVADILEGYDALNDALSDFVMLVQNGEHTELHVNADGDEGGAFTAIAMFDGGLDATLADMVNNGNLVADQSVQL